MTDNCILLITVEGVNMRMSENISHIREEINQIDKDSLNIVLVAHAHEPRGNANTDQIQCASVEMFSVDEFYEIYQGIVAAGFFISQTYFNELDLISGYLQSNSYFDNCVIYNLARNGIGYNKKAVIPSFCDLVGLRYTSSSSFSCSLCRNKYLFSTFLETHNIPVPKTWMQLPDGQWINGSPPDNTMVIYKPCAESASQGISMHNVFKYSDRKICKGKRLLVQEFIDGYECEVPIIEMNGLLYTLPPVLIDLKGESIIDEKMSSQYSYGFLDASKLHNETILLMEKYAEKAFRLLDMRNYGRIDFRINKDGIPYIFDVSTMPYTIKHSSVAFAFHKLELSYGDIYSTIITSAITNK